MYFLTDVEKKALLCRVLPTARKVGVSEELRGWNWQEAPLKPFYPDEGISNHLVGSQYCTTGRDVFVSRVKGIKGETNVHVLTGSAVHKAVSAVVTFFVEGKALPDFEDWWKKQNLRFGGESMDGPHISDRWKGTCSQSMGPDQIRVRRSSSF